MTICVLLHGAGSTPEFIRRAFGPKVGDLGWSLVAPDIAGMDMAAIVETVAAADPDVVGGVSLGAHAAIRFAVERDWHGPIYAVMPAWLGEPGRIASLTALTAEQIEATSPARIVGRIIDEAPDDWVTAEIARAWSTMPTPHLVEALRVAAAQPAPDVVELQSVAGRVAVVALSDDPTHPEAISHTWADHLRNCTLHVMPRDLGGRAPQALADWLPDLLPAVSSSR